LKAQLIYRKSSSRRLVQIPLIPKCVSKNKHAQTILPGFTHFAHFSQWM